MKFLIWNDFNVACVLKRSIMIKVYKLVLLRTDKGCLLVRFMSLQLFSPSFSLICSVCVCVCLLVYLSQDLTIYLGLSWDFLSIMRHLNLLSSYLYLRLWFLAYVSTTRFHFKVISTHCFYLYFVMIMHSET